MEIVFATGNMNKVKEVSLLLGNTLKINGLKDIDCPTDLPETHETLEENALEKAHYVADNYHVNCFSEDTGLEVEALNGAPGVYSARFAGPQKKDADNIALLLKKLEGQTNRKARFRTVIALILDEKEYLFEGIAEGEIITEPTGTDGFGYDPVFRPLGEERTFAQMNTLEKSKMSHRGKAVEKLVEFLKKYQKS